MRNQDVKGTSSESREHKLIKISLLKLLLKYSKNVKFGNCEKYLETRRGDIYLELRDDKKVVIEIQNSPISVKETIKRTKDYTRKDIYVMWILNSKGKCNGAQKYPKDQKHVKVSPFELFLNKIYGGRTYYIHLDLSKPVRTISKPYALHFSLSDKKSSRIRKKKFQYYYLRNSNFIKPPNLDILCVDFGLKLARFYDKNIKTIIKSQIKHNMTTLLVKSCKNCQLHFKWLRRCDFGEKCNFKPIKRNKMLKIIFKKYKKKYGEFLISQALKDINSKAISLMNKS